MGDNDFTESEEDMLRRYLREAQDKIARYEAAADATPVPEGVAGTTGQLWHKMLQADEAGRYRLLGWFMEIAERDSSCFAENHRGRLDHLQFELQDVQAKLSTTLGFDTPQSLHSLTVAVQALRNVMVERLAAREPQVEYRAVDEPAFSIDDLLPKFPAAPSVQEKIGEQLKAAGIDTSAVCGFEVAGWPSIEEDDYCASWSEPLGAGEGGHRCAVVNPLHAGVHECKCGAQLGHDQAERLVMEANR